PLSLIAPQPIYHLLSQKQKENIKEVLDKKYKELEEPKPILDILENYMTFRSKLDDVMMRHARLNNNEFSKEDRMRIIKLGLPKKMCDPVNFLLPVSVNGTVQMNALANTRASVCVMPFSLYKNLGLRSKLVIKAYLANFLVLDISVINMGRGTISIHDGVIRHTYFPKPRAKAYLENFEIDEEDDWLSCFEVGRDEDGNPMYGPVTPSFLDIEDEMEKALAI
ncbi:hypothetical protein Tco_1139007, partial [Tanacetum coccineum]